MPRLVEPVDREACIQRMKDLTRERGRRVTRPEFTAATGVSNFQMIREFGGYNGLLKACGLPPHLENQRKPDHDMMQTLRDACLSAGHVVSQTEFDRIITKGAGQGRFLPYHRRWGRWPNVLAALRVWVRQHDPGFLHRAGLPGETEVPDPPALRPPAPRRYGQPFHFPGFLHEPVNEQGVVLLFGAMAKDLGFAVESVTGGFPDCEAKRRVGETWERVRIEFEFQSRNFVTHRHDAQGCDLIVCWEDNWNQAPIEVIALKQEIAKLRKCAEPAPERAES